MTSTGTGSQERTGSQEQIAFGRVESYRPDEFVVGIPYAGEVKRQLVEWYAKPEIAEKDPRLGLALIKLSAGAAVEQLRATRRDWLVDAINAARAEVADPSNLDLVLRCLRRYFREE